MRVLECVVGWEGLAAGGVSPLDWFNLVGWAWEPRMERYRRVLGPGTSHPRRFGTWGAWEMPK